MTKHGFASIILKLIGFYVLINNLSVSMVSFIPFLNSPQQAEVYGKFKYIIMIPILSYILIGLVLIMFADFFASLIIEKNENDEANFNITADDLQRVLFSFWGLYFMTISIPKLTTIAINIVVTNNQANYLNPRFSGDLAGGVIQFVLGLAVFFGSKGLVGLLKLLRYSGKSNNEND